MATKPPAAALKKFEERFTKSFGEKTLEKGSKINPWPVISTGSLALDYALGVGGLVEGRAAEFWGQEGIGKSTMAFYAIAEAQAKHPDKVCGYIDMEQKLDKSWAAAHGVDLARLYVYTPDSAEDVADAMKEMVTSDLFALVVLDSIGGMIPEAEKEKDANQATMAIQAKIVTRMVKILAVEARKTGTAIIYINQVRANLSGFGKATTTGGGWALRHATTMKLEFKRTGTTPFKAKVHGEDVIVGHEIAVYVERNGVAPAYRTATLVMFNQATDKYGPLGIDRVDEAVTLGLKHKAIAQSGAFYTLPASGVKVQGRDKLVAELRTSPEDMAEIRRRVLAEKADEVYEDEQVEPEPEGDPEDAELGAIAASIKTPQFRRGVPDPDPSLMEEAGIGVHGETDSST